MEYKDEYTKQEVEELVAWFEAHEHELPQSMQIDDSAFSADLKKTVRIFMEQSLMYWENPTFNGTIRMLYLIKSKIENKE